MIVHRLTASVALLGMSFAFNASAQTVRAGTSPLVEEDTSAVVGPIDYGYGPAVRLKTSEKAAWAARPPEAADASVPVGGPGAHTNGFFAPPVTWPLVMIHATMLPDGRVFMNGTREERKGQLIYDVWDPRPGGGHLTLDNTTETDVFCSGQSVFANSGILLVAGGNTIRNGVNNIGVPLTTTFDPSSNWLSPGPSMLFDRWYPSVVPLAGGDKLIVGGRETPTIYSPTPELVTQAGDWRTLTGAKSDAAFGIVAWNWSYPRAYQMPNDAGKVFVLGSDGKMFYLNLADNGSITELTQTTLAGDTKLPTVMFEQGKLLSIRNGSKAVVVDINGAQPTITTTADMSQVRYYASATVLPDGKVLVTGGSSVGNSLPRGAAYAAEIWDPATGQWTLGANALKPRLYHSNALLLTDGTVLTGGGGRPGPVINLNAEIYYPAYLYDANGNPAPRPTLDGTPESLTLSPAMQFSATVGTSDLISRVTLVRAGSATHNMNLEQSFQQLPFTQAGNQLTITAPANPTYTIPGYYLLFALNLEGVPSEAKILKILS
jgi:hypothetical protein